MSTIDLLDRLVSFPTISADSNLPLVDFVRNYLTERGFSCHLILNATGTKANLFASIGPSNNDGVILSGHTDVVPVAGQAWSTDPFRLVARDGKLHGRGAADMKGFLACMLTAADAASQRKLARPLHLAFSHDEEIGCVGVRSMLDDLADRSLRASICVVGEPTSMQIVNGHKGKLAARATCHGVGGHSSMAPLHLNAIHLATDFVGLLRQFQHEIAKTGAQDEAYSVPYSTLHAGRIGGGVALNVVASEAFVNFELRHLVADNPHDILRRLQDRIDLMLTPIREKFPTANIIIEINNAYPGLDIATDDPAVGLLGGILEQDNLSKVSFGTEAGLFVDRLNISTLVVGPGSMDQGHKPDEFIATDQLEKCDAFLLRLLDKLEA
jgi:acetylornithine deacetylase